MSRYVVRGEANLGGEKHTAVRACTKRGILASNLGRILIVASLPNQVYRQAGIAAEGNTRGDHMD
jgi:hypothetical protein